MAAPVEARKSSGSIQDSHITKRMTIRSASAESSTTGGTFIASTLFDCHFMSYPETALISFSIDFISSLP